MNVGAMGILAGFEKRHLICLYNNGTISYEHTYFITWTWKRVRNRLQILQCRFVKNLTTINIFSISCCFCFSHPRSGIKINENNESSSCDWLDDIHRSHTQPQTNCLRGSPIENLSKFDGIQLTLIKFVSDGDDNVG